MFKFVICTTIVLTITRLTSGYDDLIGLPEELDDDIWNENPQSTNPRSETSEALLQKLCESYDFSIDHRIIDCNKLKLVKKTLKVPEEHHLTKREVEEGDLDGSGDDAEPSSGTPHQKEGGILTHESSEHANNSLNHLEPTETLNKYQSSIVVDTHAANAEEVDDSEKKQKNAKLIELPAVTTEHQQETSAEQSLTTSATPDAGETHTAPKQSGGEFEGKKLEQSTTTLNVPNEETPLSTKQRNEIPSSTQKPHAEQNMEKQPEETTTEQLPTTTRTTIPLEKNVDTSISSSPQPVQDEKTIDVSTISSTSTPASIAPKERQGRNSNNPGDKPDSTVEKDEVLKQQTDVETKMENTTVQEVERKGRKLAPSGGTEEKEIAAAGVGESTESVGQKDTKILLGLFGAVIGMGAIAFIYNHIRKKKRSNLGRSSNGVGHGSPEEGREMKPLMKNGEDKKPTIDYKDEKQGRSEEVKS